MECHDASRLTDALSRWKGSPVAVRVVAETDELVAVFTGILGARSPEEHPLCFWPIEPGDQAFETLERRGVYVHPDLLTEVRVHTGEFVIEYTQAGVTVNLRRLEHP